MILLSFVPYPLRTAKNQNVAYAKADLKADAEKAKADVENKMEHAKADLEKAKAEHRK